MFLISATFNMCNYEDIMKRYDCKVALSVVELLREGAEPVFWVCIVCSCSMSKLQAVIMYLTTLKGWVRDLFLEHFFN